MIFLVVCILLIVSNALYGFYLKKITSDDNFAQAMSFNSGWNMTINSVSSSKSNTESSNNKLDLSYSYQNPFFEYPNLSKTFQEDPVHVKNLVTKVQEYIERNRSKDNFDHNLELPVRAEFYLEIAIKYHVPIDQMLAVARSESRFGSDCFTASGNLNRICTYKNIFSIGLTESSSLGFETWEQGVEAFGKLYESRKNRGYDDCKIWQIYNPNGDYCGKILDLSRQINTFINEV